MPEQSGYELLDEILSDIADALREKIGEQTVEELVTNSSNLNYDILKPKTGFIMSTTGACRTNLTNKTHKCIMGNGYSNAISDDILLVFENDSNDVQEADISFTSDTSFKNNSANAVTLRMYKLYWRGSTGSWSDEVGSGTTIAAGGTYNWSDGYLYDITNKFSNTKIVTIPLTNINAQDFSTLIRSI